MEATSHQENPRKRQRIEEDCPNAVNHEEPESPPEPQDPQGKALSNHIVLKNIFGFLSPEDLDSCRNQCRIWREVANPLSFLRCDIEIKTNHFECEPIILAKTSPKNLPRQKQIALTFEEATKTLDEAPDTRTLALNLIVDFKIDNPDDRVENFISKFGALVKHMDLPKLQRVGINKFCDFVRKFPNLESMKCPTLLLTEDPENADLYPELPNYQHSKLKKIIFGMRQFSPSELIGKFLKIASNLREIEELPIWLINAVVVAEKGKALKSVAYHNCHLEQFGENDETVLLAIQKLAQLEPRLSSFSFLPSESSLEEGTSMDMIKPFVSSILQSSAESLRSFEFNSTKCVGIENIPVFKGVKTLIFQDDYVKGKLFSADISLSEIFPNVNEIRSLFFMEEHSLNGILPAGRESSWGSQITRLEVLHVRPRTLQLLGNMFPLIEDLTFSGSARDVEENFPVMAELWPQLKSMTILITNGWNYRNLGPGRFDCAFTGLPPRIVTQLLDPSKRGDFSHPQIQRFKNESTISKFKELQRLTLTRSSAFRLIDPVKIYRSLTPVAYKFGFELLPHLKVSVRILKDVTWKATKRALGPLARSKNVEILDLYPNLNR